MDTQVDYGVDIKWEIDSIREIRGERCDDEVVRKVVLSGNCSHTSGHDIQFQYFDSNHCVQFQLSGISPWSSRLDLSHAMPSYSRMEYIGKVVKDNSSLCGTRDYCTLFESP
jgi:hypothetical protein